VRPSVEGLIDGPLANNEPELIRQSVRANIRSSADHLRHGSELLEKLIDHKGLLVVGAEYSLDTGVVDFFHGMPKGR
jgi:carbonic anhydrase